MVNNIEISRIGEIKSDERIKSILSSDQSFVDLQIKDIFKLSILVPIKYQYDFITFLQN